MPDDFEDFVRAHEPRLRRALVAAYGPEDGRDAAAGALAWAWEHWEKVRSMDNPVGYLFRVGQSSRRRRKVPRLDRPHGVHPPAFEPDLTPALAALSEKQRVCVLLVEGYQWTQTEVAELLGVSVSSVRTHLRRGLAHLQRTLGEVSDGVR